MFQNVVFTSFLLTLQATATDLKLISLRYSNVTDHEIGEVIWDVCSAGIVCSDCRKLQLYRKHFRYVRLLELSTLCFPEVLCLVLVMPYFPYTGCCLKPLHLA